MVFLDTRLFAGSLCSRIQEEQVFRGHKEPHIVKTCCIRCVKWVFSCLGKNMAFAGSMASAAASATINEKNK